MSAGTLDLSEVCCEWGDMTRYSFFLPYGISVTVARRTLLKALRLKEATNKENDENIQMWAFWGFFFGPLMLCLRHHPKESLAAVRFIGWDKRLKAILSCHFHTKILHLPVLSLLKMAYLFASVPGSGWGFGELTSITVSGNTTALSAVPLPVCILKCRNFRFVYQGNWAEQNLVA